MSNFEKNSYSKFVKGITNIEKVNPTYDQFIIKPPERNKTHGRIGVKLVIDSRDRDKVLYPDTNNYKYYTPEEYKDVVSAELVLGEFPNSGYNLYDKNNQMIIESGSILEKIIVPPGEYNNSSLINLLNGSKGDLFSEFTKQNIYFNFYFDTDTSKIKIQSNKEFSFNLDYNIHDRFRKCNQGDIDKYYESIKYYSIDNVIGFSRKKHTGENKYSNDECEPNLTTITISSVTPGAISPNGYNTFEADLNTTFDARQVFNIGDYIDDSVSNTYRIIEIINKSKIVVEDINGSGGPAASFSPYYAIFATHAYDIECPQYVILDIPQFHYLKSVEASIAKSFVVIPLRPGCKTILDSGRISLDKEIKYFNPPLARLSSLDIRFLRYDGSYYNFEGRNHMFILKITTLNQPGKYNNFNPGFFGD